MKRLLLFFFLLQLLFLTFFYFQENVGYNSLFFKFMVIAVIINIFIFLSIWKQNLHKSQLVSLCFVFSYIIVFFQKYIDLALGLITESDTLFASPETIVPCCIISFVGLLSFFIGYLLFKPNLKKKKEIFSNSILSLLKKGLVVSTILYVIYNYQNIYIQRSQELLEAQAGTMVLYSKILFLIFSNLVIVYSVLNIKSLHKECTFYDYVKFIGFRSNICLLVVCLLIIFSGARANVISIIFLYYGGYLIISMKKIPKIKIAVLLILAVIFMSSLGRARQLDQQQSFGDRMSTGLTVSREESTISPFTNELAGSVKTLHYSYFYIPNYYPYMYGIFQIKQVFSAIPFFNHVIYQFTDRSKKYISSSFFITWLIQGDYYTYGSGSSCNADLYIAFGIFGVIFGLLIWGIILKKVEMIWKSGFQSSSQLIILLSILSQLIFVCRDSLLCFVNVMFFTLIIDYLLRKVVHKLH